MYKVLLYGTNSTHAEEVLIISNDYRAIDLDIEVMVADMNTAQRPT